MANSLASGQKPTGVADLDSSQTLENKTLDSTSTVNGSDVIAASIQSPVRADVKKDTLANLQTYALTASNGQLCFATDAKKMYQVLDAALAEVGSGQGGINYISNPDFELNVDGYTSDVNLTIARSTVAPLRGDASGVISKAAVDASGEVVKIPFTIESADLAKKLYISFDKDASDPNYADGDLRVEVIKDPNGTPVTIRCNAEDILGGKGSHLAWFQTDASILEYELVFKCNSSNASAYSVKIDNIQVGPREVSYGASLKGYNYTIRQSGNALTDASSEVQFNLGTASIVDASAGRIVAEDDSSNTRTKFNFTEKGIATIHWSHFTANVSYPIIIHYNSAGSVVNTYNGGRDSSATQVDLVIQLEVKANEFITVSSTAGVRATTNEAVVNIGFISKSDIIQSEDIGNREIRVRGAGNSAITVTAGVTPITFTETEDTTNSFDGSTFTAPEAGDYRIDGNVRITAALDIQVQAYVNGSLVFPLGGNYGSQRSHHFSGTIHLEKEDLLTLRSNVTATLENNTTLHNIHIQKLAQPQTILETETVAFAAKCTSGQVIPSLTYTTVIYNEVENDTHGTYDNTTGIYEIGVTGFYQINARVGAIVPASAASFFLGLYVDGNVLVEDFETTDTVSNTRSSRLSEIVYLTKGQNVRAILYQNSGSSVALQFLRTRFSIARIK